MKKKKNYCFLMLEFINIREYHSIKTRKTPYIIYFNKKNDQFSKDVISTLMKLSKSFSAVFCYTCTAPRFPYEISKQEFCDYEHVYSLSKSNIYKSVLANSYSELYNLFDFVYSDCLVNHIDGFNNLMRIYHGENFQYECPWIYRPNFQFLGKKQKYFVYPAVKHIYSPSELNIFKN